MIKRYPKKRRLYCTQLSGYITLDEVIARISEGRKPFLRNLEDGSDASAEVYAQLVVKLTAAGKITAAELLEVVKAHAPQRISELTITFDQRNAAA